MRWKRGKKFVLPWQKSAGGKNPKQQSKTKKHRSQRKKPSWVVADSYSVLVSSEQVFFHPSPKEQEHFSLERCWRAQPSQNYQGKLLCSHGLVLPKLLLRLSFAGKHPKILSFLKCLLWKREKKIKLCLMAAAKFHKFIHSSITPAKAGTSLCLFCFQGL